MKCIQIITPYRGDLFGTESINLECQRHSCGDVLDRVGGTGGITLFDKVIQIRNRPRSYPIKAMDTRTGRVDDLEIFNGQLGFVMPFKYDERRWGNRDFRLERFDVIFSRRENHRVGFGSHLGKGCPNESVEGNLELAYAISVHKAQGSEFSRTYVVIPKEKARLLSRELFYTALTRASRHCTLLIQQDISPLLEMRRPHKSYLELINSSLFEFRAVPEALLSLGSWYEEGKIHETLAEVMVRSKSEVIIANMLHEREIPFTYENPLYAPDGTFYLPDFTVTWRGENYFWEHVGMLHRRDYRQHWEKKRTWYEKFFPGKLIITEESGHLSLDADEVIRNQFR